ncbi:IS1634 family transposase [Deferribacter autotrophicus]|uniref:IS1634 family transposase n=1 Tax=Deferribacter autotrophicus TaxID=500465 RepID=A0A5A8EZE7_9BACT|nr:IS1634 family transposase [Deferribacter autotrophicus]KAA0256863.1 IS1634 family transposase [Deferribacter autotrophicus]KAA0258771.1 IS1634 family transposase [Deferribacter autotrophicus]
MFLRVVKSKSSSGKIHQAVQLVESYRNEEGKPRTRILYHFGPLDKFLETDADKFVDSIMKLKGEVFYESIKEFGESKDFGDIFVVLSILKELKLFQELKKKQDKESKIQFDVVSHFKALLTNRISEPSSKLKLLSWLETVYIPGLKRKDISYENLLRTMDFLIKHKKEIENKLAKRVLTMFDLNLKMCFYDITSSYFETSSELDSSDIRRYGYSRDNRPDRVQVTIGVVMTEEGIPLCHYVFEGNRVDKTTLISVIEDIKLRFGELIEVSIVTDKGMISSSNLDKLIEGDQTFIIGEDKNKKISREILSEANLNQRNKEEEFIFEKELDYETSNGKLAKLRYVLSFNPETYRLNMKRYREKLSLFENKFQEINKKRISVTDKYHLLKSFLKSQGMSRWYKLSLSDGKIDVEPNMEVLNRLESGFGWFMVVSNLSKLDYSKEEIIESYKKLWRVEHGFRELKHSLEVRPMYHFSENRIRGHIFLCFLSMLVTSIMEKRLKDAGVDLSWEKALFELRKLKTVSYLTNSGIRGISLTRVTDRQKKIFKALGCPIPKLRHL